jgi:hypothetical protein
VTVSELIEILQQWQGNPAIASVHIEFGDGSIYDDPPNTQRASLPEKQTSIDQAVEQFLENTRKVAAVFPAFLRSAEKVKIEQRPNGFYWVLSWEVGGPFNSEEEAREGLKRYDEKRLEREHRGE